MNLDGPARLPVATSGGSVSERSLTHGCIRVGRDDLREVARLAHPGTPVLIF